MSQIPAPGLTPHDRRTVLDALVTAEGALRDRIAACVICGHYTTPCPSCEERLNKIAEFSALAIRMRGGS